MANSSWKKIIVSGSNAAVSGLVVDNNSVLRGNTVVSGTLKVKGITNDDTVTKIDDFMLKLADRQI